MAYNVHYRIPSSRFSGGITTIDILDNTYSGSVVPLAAGGDPLNITFNGDVNNIFAPTLDSFAVINVIANPLTLQGLFTNDPQRYMVKIYNGSTGINLIWQGFVNTGVYNETLDAGVSSYSPSGISINCNDGMSVLDQLNYIGSDGVTLYTGDVSIGTILTNILSKISGLTFNNVYKNSDLTTDSYNSNFFTGLNVNNDNYIDENNIPMTCRQVLDSIFGGMGLVMSFKGSDIYLIDPINLASSTYSKTYTLGSFTENTSTFGGNLDISNKDINWFQTGSSLDVVPQLNEVDINYDPYNLTKLSYDFNANAAGGAGFTGVSQPVYYDVSTNFPGWTEVLSDGTTPTTLHYIGVEQTLLGPPTYFIRLFNGIGRAGGPNDIISYEIPHSNINPSSVALSMKISFDAYAQTRESSPNSLLGSSGNKTEKVFQYFVKCSIKVGDQWWNGAYWSSSYATSYLRVRQDGITDDVFLTSGTKSSVENTWTSAIGIISLTGMHAGPITISIIDFWEVYAIGTAPYGVNCDTFANFHGIFLKNLNVEFTDTHGKTIENNGVLTKGHPINLIYKNTTTTISLTNGTGPYGISKGTYLTNGSNLAIVGLYRISSYYDTAKLLLQSIQSQYSQPRIQLSGDLDVKNTLLNTNLKLIKDSTYYGSKTFYIVNGTYNDRSEYLSAVMIECVNTRDTIS